MSSLGTRVDFMELEVTFRRVSSKIESALILEELSSHRLIQDAEDLRSVQRNLKARLERIIRMFPHSRGMGQKGNHSYLDVFASSQEGLAVLKAVLLWFAEKQQEMEARVNHILVLKVTEPLKPASPQTSVKQTETGIKLEPIKEDVEYDSARSEGKGKEKVRSSRKDTKRSDLDEHSKGKMVANSDKETDEVAGKSDNNLNTSQATAPYGNLFIPRRRLADRLKLNVVFDNDWEPIEAILTKSSELSVALAILLVELYVQLLPQKKEEGMSEVLIFLQYLDELVIENSRREMVKWILHAVKVGDEQLRHLEIVAGPPGKSTADEVHNLVRMFTRTISDLEDLNDFGRLKESGLTVKEAVAPLTEQLNGIERDINVIDKHMAEHWIKLYHGVWAPIILFLVNRIGMCFKTRFYRGKLR